MAMCKSAQCARIVPAPGAPELPGLFDPRPELEQCVVDCEREAARAHRTLSGADTAVRQSAVA
jgi:hypothetical protein